MLLNNAKNDKISTPPDTQKLGQNATRRRWDAGHIPGRQGCVRRRPTSDVCQVA